MHFKLNDFLNYRLNSFTRSMGLITTSRISLLATRAISDIVHCLLSRLWISLRHSSCLRHISSLLTSPPISLLQFWYSLLSKSYSAFTTLIRHFLSTISRKRYISPYWYDNVYFGPGALMALFLDSAKMPHINEDSVYNYIPLILPTSSQYKTIVRTSTKKNN